MPFLNDRLLLKAGSAMLMGIASLSNSAAKDVTIAHAKGETILHAIPTKAVAYDLATLDNLNALGIEAVAGVPKGTQGTGNFPAYMSKYADAKYRNVGTLFEPDIAALTALRPDLIFVGGRSSSKYAELAAIAPTIDMTSSSKNLAEATADNVRKLGQIFSVTDRAERRVVQFEAQLADLHTQAAKSGTGLLLFAAGQGVTVHAPGDRFGHMYDFVGIRSAVAPESGGSSGPRPAAGSPEAEVARQQQQQAFAAALATNPDWLFVIDRTAATSSAPSTIREKLAADERVAGTSAWKAGRVVYLDPKSWYIVGAGIDALSKSASDILAALRAPRQ